MAAWKTLSGRSVKSSGSCSGAYKAADAVGGAAMVVNPIDDETRLPARHGKTDRRTSASMRTWPDGRTRRMHPMSPVRHFDHVGITVRDLDTVTAFFAGLGFETEGRTVLEGEFLDTHRHT